MTYPPKVAVQQPVQKGIPKTITQGQPRHNKIQGRRDLFGTKRYY